MKVSSDSQRRLHNRPAQHPQVRGTAVVLVPRIRREKTPHSTTCRRANDSRSCSKAEQHVNPPEIVARTKRSRSFEFSMAEIVSIHEVLQMSVNAPIEEMNVDVESFPLRLRLKSAERNAYALLDMLGLNLARLGISEEEGRMPGPVSSEPQSKGLRAPGAERQDGLHQRV